MTHPPVNARERFICTSHATKSDENAPNSRLTYVWASTRIVLAGVFLWAFFDKLLGLGYATKPENAWIAGGSPTTGFLKFGANGAFGSFFQGLAGLAIVDWVFMIGLLGIGLALLLGVGMKIAAVSGATMMMLMYLAVMPGANNPVVDDHVVYALVLVGLAMAGAGRTFGLGAWWSRQRIVEKYPILE